MSRHANVEGGAAQPTCPICLRTVTPGDLVVFGHGELVHLACQTSVADETVARFLRSSPGRRYCHTCLARALNLTWKDTAKVVTRLRIAPGFRVVPAQCGLCAELRVTIAAS